MRFRAFVLYTGFLIHPRLLRISYTTPVASENHQIKIGRRTGGTEGTEADSGTETDTVQRYSRCMHGIFIRRSGISLSLFNRAHGAVAKGLLFYISLFRVLALFRLLFSAC